MKKVLFFLIISVGILASCTKKSSKDELEEKQDKEKNSFDFIVNVSNQHSVPNTAGEVEYDLLDSCYNIGKAIEFIDFYDEYTFIMRVSVQNGVAKWLMRPSKQMRNTPYLTQAVAINNKGDEVNRKEKWYFYWE